MLTIGLKYVVFIMFPTSLACSWFYHEGMSDIFKQHFKYKVIMWFLRLVVWWVTFIRIILASRMKPTWSWRMILVLTCQYFTEKSTFNFLSFAVSLSSLGNAGFKKRVLKPFFFLYFRKSFKKYRCWCFQVLVEFCSDSIWSCVHFSWETFYACFDLMSVYGSA